jgi:hypothetical protein
VKRSSGEESFGYVKVYDAKKQVYTVELDKIGSGTLKQCGEGSMRDATPVKLESVPEEREELAPAMAETLRGEKDEEEDEKDAQKETFKVVSAAPAANLTDDELLANLGDDEVSIENSVAISGNTTVTVPPGFYQPIFSVREVTTKVTIWDGATLVMGGLTREEVKKVTDKVPFFGDIPFVGRLFRSKGESSQKRNLLIFVTANLVSPGGSPKKQDLKNTPATSLFQNPTIVTPASAEARTRSGNK